MTRGIPESDNRLPSRPALGGGDEDPCSSEFAAPTLSSPLPRAVGAVAFAQVPQFGMKPLAEVVPRIPRAIVELEGVSRTVVEPSLAIRVLGVEVSLRTDGPYLEIAELLADHD